MCVIYWEVEKCLISVACKGLFTYNYFLFIACIIYKQFFCGTPFDNIRTIPSTLFFTLIVLYSVCNCFISVCINVN